MPSRGADACTVAERNVRTAVAGLLIFLWPSSIVPSHLFLSSSVYLPSLGVHRRNVTGVHSCPTHATFVVSVSVQEHDGRVLVDRGQSGHHVVS